MSDTPETNNASFEDGNGYWSVPQSFTRKLERERNALRNLLAIALQHGLTDQVRAEAREMLKEKP